MWTEQLKQAGVNIHVIATGGGAGLQRILWEVPGSSAFLSGCTFPYSTEEQEELLGFKPEHFCSEEAAIDLASAAYMKAYKFGGKKPVGVGITASVASEKEHRGDHRIYVCAIYNDSVKLYHHILKKDVGRQARYSDGKICDGLGLSMLLQAVGVVASFNYLVKQGIDATEQARERFFKRPFFTANGKRLESLPTNKHLALMSGAFNPPHEGHTNTAQHVLDDYNKTVVYEITAVPPHKEAMSVQDLLQRAKLLQGTDRIFTKGSPLYKDKARAFPGVPLVLGADAMIRMLDPKWGVEPYDLLSEFAKLNTNLLVSGRLIGDKFVSCENILSDIYKRDHYLWKIAQDIMYPVKGRVDISSTELRNKTINI